MGLPLIAALDVLRRVGTAAWGLARLAVTLPLGVLVAALLAALLLSHCEGQARYRAGYAKGEAHERAEWQKVAAKIKRVRELLSDRMASISEDERRRLDRRRGEIRDDTANLRQKVKTYVPPAADARCVVPLGFVRLINDGIDGPGRRPPEIAGAAGRPNEADSGLALSDVSDQLLGGFEIPYGWRAENEAWRGWYPRVCAEWRRAGGICELSP